MKIPFSFSNYSFLLLAAVSLTLTACKKDSEDADTAAGDGTVTWTHNGVTYTGNSAATASAIVDTGDKIIITGASKDNNNVVSLGLPGINAKGPGVYELRKGSMIDNLPAAAITLNGGTAQGSMFYTLYGPGASNGSITIIQYDKASQKLSGTFTFTAGALPNTSASGTQNVTSGSFSFTKFH
jgi:hypothetical protein